MDKADNIFKELQDLIESLKLSDRFQHETFKENWALRRQKIVDDIATLTRDEYTYLENKYKKWLGPLHEDSNII